MSAPRQLAVVTGTTSGIGRALAESLLKGGWRVVGVARRAAPLEHVDYTHIACDLADQHALATELAPQLRDLMDQADLERVALVNNAAIIGELAWLHELDSERLGRLLAVNVQAPMVLMGLAVQAVPAGVPLRVVNISSGAAHTPFPGLGDYSASKAALRLAGQTMAAEFERRGLTPGQAAVFSYEPGLVDTVMQDQARDADAGRFPASQAFHDFADQGLLHPPESVVGEVVDFMTGEPMSWFTEHRFGAS